MKINSLRERRCQVSEPCDDRLDFGHTTKLIAFFFKFQKLENL